MELWLLLLVFLPALFLRLFQSAGGGGVESEAECSCPSAGEREGIGVCVCARVCVSHDVPSGLSALSRSLFLFCDDDSCNSMGLGQSAAVCDYIIGMQ